MLVNSSTQHAHVVTENIDAYMKDIKRFGRIDHKREAELSEVIHHGSATERDKAMEELICSNLRLVVKIAHDFKRYGVTFADLVAEGNCGLMTAARKFDPAKGARFSCYAAWWIKQNMRQAVANQTRTVRVPGGTAQKTIQLSKLSTAFVNENGREPTTEELCEMMSCSEKTLQTIQMASIQIYSIDEQVQDGESTTFEDMLADTPEVKNTYGEERLTALRGLLPKLTDKEQLIITFSYGIGCAKQPDLVICQEVGMPLTELNHRRLCILAKLRDGLLAA